MNKYEVRIGVTIMPEMKLVTYGNQFNDYKTIAVKDGDGTCVRLKGANGLREIVLNNYEALLPKEKLLNEALTLLAKQNGNKVESKLYQILQDMLDKVLSAKLKFEAYGE